MVAVDWGKGTVGQVHTRASLPEVDAVIAGDVDVADGVFKAVVMVFGWCRIRLGEFDAGKCDVRTTCRHGPDEFADTGTILNLHFSGKFGLIGGICWANSRVELLQPRWVSWERGRPGGGEGDFTEPGVEVLLAEF
jgi:hypothetical protein